MKILVTGCAGFIGFSLVQRLCENSKFKVYGIDNINSYYDINLKKNRLSILKKKKNFRFFKLDITDGKKISKNFNLYKYNIVFHLAAQAGVRFSITNPDQYISSNLVGFFNIINSSSKIKIKHFIFASSSSVYGNSTKFPLKEDENTDYPLSLYAATKKSNEVIAHSYSNIFKLPCTGLRFFTVYGPYGRPDMALFKFTKNTYEGKGIKLFNKGNHTRDFTYIDDVVTSLVKLIDKPSNKFIPFEIFNISNNNPVQLRNYLNTIFNYLNKKARIKNLDLQIGDVKKTWGSNKKLEYKIKFSPNTKIKYGIKKFIEWYKNYYE